MDNQIKIMRGINDEERALFNEYIYRPAHKYTIEGLTAPDKWMACARFIEGEPTLGEFMDNGELKYNDELAVKFLELHKKYDLADARDYRLIIQL